MKPLLCAAGLLAAALLTACGAGDADTAPSAGESLDSIDVCALLTAAEIEAATGIAPGAPEDQSGGSAPPMCNWPARDGGYAFAANVLVVPSRNYASFDEALAEWQESTEGMGMEFDAAAYQEVEGPGKVNAWLHEAGMLQVFSGDRMVQVYVLGAPPDRDRLQAATALAEHALARLE